MSGAGGRSAAVFAALFSAAVLALTVAAHSRNSKWRDNLSIFADSVAKGPANFNMRLNLGMAYKDLGMLDEAAREFQKAVDRQPLYADARNNLANVNLVLGRYALAAAEYEKVLEIDPAHVEARYNLATAYLALGKEEEAARHFRIFLRVYTVEHEETAAEVRALLDGMKVRGGAKRPAAAR